MPLCLQIKDNIRRFKSFITLDIRPMKRPYGIPLLIFLAILLTGTTSCGMIHNIFGPKYGCPSDGRNVGAERILSGEKVPKAGKFRGGS
jgi:hypothetical protein